VTLGFVWDNGRIRPLPTLGGNNAPAFGGANEAGQIVGTAEIAAKDPSCQSPQVFDFEAVVWGPNDGEIHQFPLLSGDQIGAATAINDNGQVVRGSGGCTSPSFASIRHAVL
jgi:uncharacterized membrane protein